jgi:type I restriction enzyme R subunit
VPLHRERGQDLDSISKRFYTIIPQHRSEFASAAVSVREQLTEEELVVFNLLTRPGPDLSTEERDEVKKVACQLVERLTSILTVDWQKTATARARI